MKLMIATPAFSGKVDIPYAVSLASTLLLLAKQNIGVQFMLVPSGSLLVAERNSLVEAFWESDCTHMLCIDSDLGWPAEAVLAMLHSGKEFVAGVYPARGAEKTFLFRPERNPDETLVTEKHLIKMQYIPSGFMLLAKSTIEKMRKAHPDLKFEPKDKSAINARSGYCFFNTEVWEGEFWGEDFVFCRKAREAGVEIWVDPLIQFDHAGTIGMLAQALQPKNAHATLSLAA